MDHPVKSSLEKFLKNQEFVKNLHFCYLEKSVLELCWATMIERGEIELCFFTQLQWTNLTLKTGLR